MGDDDLRDVPVFDVDNDDAKSAITRKLTKNKSRRRSAVSRGGSRS